MKPWINEELFASWTQAQRRLWNSLCAAVPFQPPVGIEAWRETYLKNLDTWETAVKRTLAQEATWVRHWVEQVAQEKNAPELMTAWVRQMEEVLQRWVQTQTEWWDEYFKVLRRGSRFMDPEQAGIGLPPTSRPMPKSAVSAHPKPAAHKTPVTTTPAAPVAADPAPVSTNSPAAPAVSEVALQQSPDENADVQPVAAQPAAPDDLKLIIGIGPAMEKKLHSQGIMSFRQLAMLRDEAIDPLDSAIKALGRIRRDDWITQAKALHLQKYQEQL